MVNLTHSLSVATDALRVNQYGMGIISTNISNMNTEGYSKQRLDLKNVSYGQQYVGSVDIDKVVRYQDEFLNSFMTQENSTYGYDKRFMEGITTIESYFNETDESGLTGALKNYFSAATSLSNDPTNKVTRSNFVAQAELLAKEFNTKYNQLKEYRENLVGDGLSTTSVKNSEIYNLTQTINSKLSEIADLNLEISRLSVGTSSMPNTLLDQRQMLIDELSEYVPITSKQEGVVTNIFVGNTQLVSSAEQIGFFDVTFTAPPDNVNNPAKVSILDKDSNTLIENYANEMTNSQGSIKALLDLGGSSPTSIKAAIESLNTLAQEFARNVNDLQVRTEIDPITGDIKASLKLNSTTGQLEVATENIFANDSNNALFDPDAITAGNITINQAVKDNPFEIATAYGLVTNDTPPVVIKPNATGDNSNALAFSTMREEKLLSLNNMTVEKKLYSIASEIGNNSAIAQSKYTTQGAAMKQLTEKKQSITGVSLDEELVDLLKYQRAYQASGQVFSAINQMMQVIINMV